MRKISLILGACSLAMLTACEKDLRPGSADEISTGTRSENPVAQAASDPYVSNEVLVKFAKGISETGRAKALARIGGQVKEKVLTRMMERQGDEGFYVVHTPIAVLDAVGKIKGLEDVEYAEPNFIYTHDAVTANDLYFTGGQLWGMYSSTSPVGTTDPKNAYGSQANSAWAAGRSGSNTVYVGIIDEGYMYTHEDLSSNAGNNPKEVAGNGVDDDLNGYKDDVYGWDFDGNNNTVFDGLSDDHGTHVAGTIGAVGGNNRGVAGVCWTVKLLGAKFLGKRGGTTANAVKAVDYFTDLKKAGLDIVATNNSWGGGGFSQALKDAIDRAGDENILFIAAAGNDGRNIETSLSYPSGYDCENIISVASITSSGAISSFSNYAATKVDLGAPGSGIYSTLPVRSGNSVASGYGSYSGTSMATPHVTGAVALYKSVNTGASAATIKNAILSTAKPTTSLAGKTATGGRLDAFAALSK